MGRRYACCPPYPTAEGVIKGKGRARARKRRDEFFFHVCEKIPFSDSEEERDAAYYDDAEEE